MTLIWSFGSLVASFCFENMTRRNKSVKEVQGKYTFIKERYQTRSVTVLQMIFALIITSDNVKLDDTNLLIRAALRNETRTYRDVH